MMDGNLKSYTNGSANGNGLTPEKRRAKKLVARKRKIWIGGGIILLALAAWFIFHGRGGNSVLDNLQTAQAFRTTLVETVSATATINPQTGAEVNIGSQVSGVVSELDTDVGKTVKAGQVIAKISVPDQQAQAQQAQAAYQASQAAYQQALTKYQQQQSGVPMEQTQTADAVTTATAQLGSAEAALNQAQKSYNLQINQAQSAVNQQAAAVNQARVAAQVTAAYYNREESLYRQGYIAASDVDTARQQAAAAQGQYQSAQAQLASAQQNLGITEQKAAADLQTAQQNVYSAQAQLKSAKAGTANDVLKQQDVLQAKQAVSQSYDQMQQARQQVQYWQALLQKAVITTPISGTVLTLSVQQGQTLAAGLQTPVLLTVCDLDKLQCDAYVDETDIGKVKLNQNATVTVDAFPDQKLQGKVVKIASGSTLQQNVVTYDVTIQIPNPNGELKPSMTASATINVGEHPDVVAVPNEAVKTNTTGSYVWVVSPGAKEPEMQPVTTGATDGTYTEIKSGLNENDTVVLAGWPPTQGSGPQINPLTGRRTGGGGGPGGGGGGGGRGGGGGGGR